MPTGAFATAVQNSTATFNLNEPIHMDFYGDGKETAGSVAWPGLVGPSSLGESGCPFQKTACAHFCLPLPGLDQLPGPPA